MKKEHIKKLIAPILVTVILLAVLAAWLVGYLLALPGILLKAGVVLVLAVLAGVSIFVLVERIKEIQGGDEDDLSHY